MALSAINSLSAHVHLRWVLGTAALTILVPLVIPIFEFPSMLLVAIVSRMFGMPELPNKIHDFIYTMIYRPEALGVVFVLIGFFVLRFLLSQAIGKTFGGKVLTLQDVPAPLPE
jgi:hypothetical protein